MNRSTRTLIVVAIAVAVAGVATYMVFLAITSRPAREVEIAHAYAVVAARPLPLGTLVTEPDVKLVPWPAANLVPGGFSTVEDVLERGVLAPIAENEPLTGNNIAVREAGAGLPPTITVGMRAISVRVNDVIGVAGFVVPGTRVDVMVILPDGADRVARVVVHNVQVLAAGTNYDQDREGKAIPSSVVTLLTTPEDAQRIGLAAHDGQIMLTLRNPLDNESTSIDAIRTTSLATGRETGAPAPAVARRPAAPRPAALPPPSTPAPYTVETIRGAQRSQETIDQ